jgi:hypothetical protein
MTIKMRFVFMADIPFRFCNLAGKRGNGNRKMAGDKTQAPNALTALS